MHGGVGIVYRRHIRAPALSRGLFLALLLAAPAARASGAFTAPAAGARLRAGGRLDVRWDAIPPGVEEMELLVSLDGGRAFARVADLDPDDRSYTWRVPALPSKGAVLAIRGRLNGRETLLFRSSRFGIEAGRGLGAAPLSYHGGELWTDAAGSPTPVEASELGGPGHAAMARPSDEQDAERSSDPAAPAPAASSEPLPHLALRSTGEPPPSGFRSPLAFPRRN